MKRLLIVLMALFFIIACDNGLKNDVIKVDDLDESNYCDNEISLISSFDTIPLINNKLIELIDEDTLYDIVIDLFGENIDCEKLRFNVNHKINPVENIKFSINYLNCDILSLERNPIKVHLNSDDKVWFNGEFVNPDSLDILLFNTFKNYFNKPYYNEILRRNRISLISDSLVNKKLFNNIVNKIIDGYLSFVNEYSIKKFNKKICNLDSLDLIAIADSVPFNLHINFPEIPTINSETFNRLQHDSSKFTNKPKSKEIIELDYYEIIDTNLIAIIDSFLLLEKACNYYSDSLYLALDICNWNWEIGEDCLDSDTLYVEISSIDKKDVLFNNAIGYTYFNNHLISICNTYTNKFFKPTKKSKQFSYENEKYTTNDKQNTKILYIDIVDDSYTSFLYKYFDGKFVVDSKMPNCPTKRIEIKNAQ